MMSSRGSIFISAGDPSADYPGRLLIEEISAACPTLEFIGLGGPQMQAAGLRTIADHTRLAILGFREVLPKIFYFFRLLGKAERVIREQKPQAVILLDYPGFNLRLARRAKRLGVPVIYYISPQLWAWGGNRIKAVRRYVDLMLVLFPFEEEFYRKQNIPVRLVGHPIVDRFRNLPARSDCRRLLGIEKDRPAVALLPGSRPQEVKRMLRVMIKAAALMKAHLPSARFVVAAVEDIPDDVYRHLIGAEKVEIVTGRTPEIIRAADLAIIASGTATVEAAWLGTPMVVVYKTGWVTYQIARRLIKLDCIGMVNIIAGRRIVPELIQHRATPQCIAQAALEILSSAERMEQMRNGLLAVQTNLGSGGAGRQAFEAIKKVVPLC